MLKVLNPNGISSNKLQDEEVKLLYEEYEAIRLCDYDMLNHHQASVIIGVSQPTFTRIYASALQKIAKALVEGRQISFECGKIYFDSNWFHCNDCRCYFNNPDKEKKMENCPLCGSQQINEFDYEIIIKLKTFKELMNFVSAPIVDMNKSISMGNLVAESYAPGVKMK